MTGLNVETENHTSYVFFIDMSFKCMTLLTSIQKWDSRVGLLSKNIFYNSIVLTGQDPKKYENYNSSIHKALTRINITCG